MEQARKQPILKPVSSWKTHRMAFDAPEPAMAGGAAVTKDIIADY